MDHAHDRVEILAIDGNAAVAGFGEQRGEIGEARLLLDGDDVGAGNGDVVDRMLRKMQQVAQHLPLDRGQVTLYRRVIFLFFLVIFVECFLQLPAKAGFRILAEQERLDAAP